MPRTPRRRRRPRAEAAWRPALRFAAAGAVLFVLDRAIPRAATTAPEPPPVETIVVDAERVDALRVRFTAEAGRPPTQADLTALIDRDVEEEMLWREAEARGIGRGDSGIDARIVERMRTLAVDPAADDATLLREARALGVDRSDPVVRATLAAQMRLLLAAEGADDAIDDAALQAWLDDHADRYRQPPRTTLEHVFLAGAGRDADAAALRDRLAAGAAPDGLGDAFPFGMRLTALAPAQLASTVGPDIATAVPTLPDGTWVGPLRSPLGVHVVRVVARDPGGLPPLDAVRGRVTAEVREAARQRRLSGALAALRAKWPVRVAPTTTPQENS